MGHICPLLCLHGVSLSGRLVGGVWHSRSFRVYLTAWLPCRMAPPYTGLSAGRLEMTGCTGLKKQQRWQDDGRVLSKMRESTMEKSRGMRETWRLWRTGDLRDNQCLSPFLLVFYWRAVTEWEVQRDALATGWLEFDWWLLSTNISVATGGRSTQFLYLSKSTNTYDNENTPLQAKVLYSNPYLSMYKQHLLKVAEY